MSPPPQMAGGARVGAVRDEQAGAGEHRTERCYAETQQMQAPVVRRRAGDNGRRRRCRRIVATTTTVRDRYRDVLRSLRIVARHEDRPWRREVRRRRAVVVPRMHGRRIMAVTWWIHSLSDLRMAESQLSARRSKRCFSARKVADCRCGRRRRRFAAIRG